MHLTKGYLLSLACSFLLFPKPGLYPRMALL
jgi:hypothetical protein